ncbi:MAG: hypothetical protein JSW08_03450 [archaeon]|nr:MAG: hypothetical protein JSW08_03450 [archaeon]
MKKILLLLILFVLCISFVSSHQPRFVENNPSVQEPYEINNPEVSQAFYSALNGQEEYFMIRSDKDFQLYVQVLQPVIPCSSGECIEEQNIYSFEIISGDYSLVINGSLASWGEYFEEFAGDYYLEGPEYTEIVGSGTYIIKVFNEENQNYGKYVLVVGKKEEFPLGEAINAIISMPKLKRYFGKSVLLSFWNMIGLFLLIGLIILAGIIIAIIFIAKAIKKRIKREGSKRNNG